MSNQDIEDIYSTMKSAYVIFSFFILFVCVSGEVPELNNNNFQ
jgi:hypothetical protein